MSDSIELSETDKQDIEYQITMLEERLKQMTPNMSAIEEYKKKVRSHTSAVYIDYPQRMYNLAVTEIYDDCSL